MLTAIQKANRMLGVGCSEVLAALGKDPRCSRLELYSRKVGDLPEREQLVLSLYYEQEMNLREIGAVLSVSESRVCQIHGQAMVRLRARLGEWRGDRDDEDADLL